MLNIHKINPLVNHKTFNFKQKLVLSQNKKYVLRPNTRGTTKEVRSYCTEPNQFLPKKVSTKIFTQPINTGTKYFHSSKTNVEEQVSPLNKFENCTTNVTPVEITPPEMKFETKVIPNHPFDSKPFDKHDIISEDLGLGHFLKRVYIGSGVGFSGALMTSLLLSPFMVSPEMAIGAIISGAVGAFGSIYVFQEKKVQFETKVIENFDKKFATIVPIYTTPKIVSFASLAFSMGLIISPIVMIAGPAIFAQAAGISLAVTAGSSLYAMRAKPGTFLPYKSVAYGALTGLVGISLGALFTGMFTGMTDLSYFLHSIDLYGGLVLFTVLNAIDTQVAIERYKERNPDHLDCSVNLMLNTLNIFIRVLEILAKAQQKR